MFFFIKIEEEEQFLHLDLDPYFKCGFGSSNLNYCGVRIYVDLDPFTLNLLDIVERCMCCIHILYDFLVILLKNADMLVPQHIPYLLVPYPPLPPPPNRQQATSYL
jgi:hypothetical protein